MKASTGQICPMEKAGNSNPTEMYISENLLKEKNKELAFGIILSLEFDSNSFISDNFFRGISLGTASSNLPMGFSSRATSTKA